MIYVYDNYCAINMGNILTPISYHIKKHHFDDLLIDMILSYLPYCIRLQVCKRHRLSVIDIIDQRKMLASDHVRDMTVTIHMPHNISYMNWITYFNGSNIDKIDFDSISSVSRQLYTTVEMNHSVRRRLLRSLLEHNEIQVAVVLVHYLTDIDPYIDLLIDYPIDLQIYINKTSNRSAHHLNGAAYLNIAFYNNDYFYDVIAHYKPEYLTEYTITLRNQTLRELCNNAPYYNGKNTIRDMHQFIKAIRRMR